MSSHVRNISESSFEFVKSDDDIEHVQDCESEEEDVVSVDGDVASETESSDGLVGDCVEDTPLLGSQPEVEDIEETPILEKAPVVEESPILERHESEESLVVEKTLESDPLGAVPVAQAVPETEEDDSISRLEVLERQVEILQERVDQHMKTFEYVSDEIRRVDERLKVMEAEKIKKDLEGISSIEKGISGEWRLVNTKVTNMHMIVTHRPLRKRVRNLLSHVVYDFNGIELISYSRFFCRVRHPNLFSMEEETKLENRWARTYVENERMITVWTNERKQMIGKRVRYIKDGQLHCEVTNSKGDTHERIYERVRRPLDVFYSIGNAAKTMLKFW